jgi:ribose transport system substrate-binding protein
MLVASAEAFEQTGRTVPVINELSGECQGLAYWKEHELLNFGTSSNGGGAAFEAMEVAMRMLAGQKPLVTSMIYPLPQITQENFNEYYEPSMKLTSTCSGQPPEGRPTPESYYDALFEGGKPAVKLEPVS